MSYLDISELTKSFGEGAANRTRRRTCVPGRMGEQQAVACDQPPSGAVYV